MKALKGIVIAAEGRKRSTTARIRRFTAITTVLCALLTAPATRATAGMQDAALHIVVIEGEESVNIIGQGTAVPTLVEVRDRNDLPVAGASVVFLLGDGGTATLNAGLQQVAATTNALGQATVTVNPIASGAVELVDQRDVPGADGNGCHRANELRDSRGSRSGCRSIQRNGRRRSRRSGSGRRRRPRGGNRGGNRGRRSGRRSGRGSRSERERRRAGKRQRRVAGGDRPRTDRFGTGSAGDAGGNGRRQRADREVAGTSGRRVRDRRLRRAVPNRERRVDGAPGHNQEHVGDGNNPGTEERYEVRDTGPGRKRGRRWTVVAERDRNTAGKRNRRARNRQSQAHRAVQRDGRPELEEQYELEHRQATQRVVRGHNRETMGPRTAGPPVREQAERSTASVAGQPHGPTPANAGRQRTDGSDTTGARKTHTSVHLGARLQRSDGDDTTEPESLRYKRQAQALLQQADGDDPGKAVPVGEHHQPATPRRRKRSGSPVRDGVDVGADAARIVSQRQPRRRSARRHGRVRGNAEQRADGTGHGRLQNARRQRTKWRGLRGNERETELRSRRVVEDDRGRGARRRARRRRGVVRASALERHWGPASKTRKRPARSRTPTRCRQP